MKVLLALLFSSVLVLGACGGSETDPQEETDTPGNDIEEGVSENGAEDEVQENIDTDEGEADSESADQSLGDQIDFTYNPEEVNQFDLHIELLTNEEWDYDFDRDDQEAEIEYENGSDSERQGSEVFQEIEDLLVAIEINHERSINEMIDEVLDALELNRDDLAEIDLDIETTAGEKIGFNYHIAEGNESATIDEFNMDINFTDRNEWDYEYELNDQDFSVEYSNQDDLSGQSAQDEMDRIASEVTIDLEQSIGELQESFLAAVEVDFSDIEEWEVDVEFEDQMKIGAKYDRS